MRTATIISAARSPARGARFQGPGAHRRRARARRSAPAAARLDRRRRAARAVSRADTLLPILARRGLHTQLVTSAVRPIPEGGAASPADDRRVDRRPAARARRARGRRPPTTASSSTSPATQITVHCTVTRQQVNRPGYLEEFLRFWSARAEVEKIWISLYTPQIGEVSPERLRRRRSAARRQRICWRSAVRYPKLAPERTDPAGGIRRVRHRRRTTASSRA